MSQPDDPGMPPEIAMVRLRLAADELHELRAAAERQGIDLDQAVTDAARMFALPLTTREVEAESMAPHITVPPEARLSWPARLGVALIGGLMRFAWSLRGRGRYAIGPGLITNGGLRLRGPGRIRIGRDLNAWARAGNNALTTFRPEATIVIGDRVRLNGAGIQAATRIEIGDDVILGSCTIVDTDHHPVDPLSRRMGAVSSRPIRIGTNVWIGGAVVLKGVNVGDNSVVGLGSVVTSDVPANVVVAGNPARVVRRL